MIETTREKNILILETRALSYSSTHVFLSEIAAQLGNMGFAVQHVFISDIEKESNVLESFIGKKYTAVIDINSHLPLANLDGKPYPDLINAPFINILADHPLHLHPVLNVPLECGVLVCLDEYHAEYAKKYYPSYKEIINIPFAGTVSAKKTGFYGRNVERGHSVKGQACFKHKSISKHNYGHGLLFAGTYTPPEYFLDHMDGETRKVAGDVVDFLNAHKGDGRILSFPEIFCELYGADGEMFAFRMYRMRAVERFMRERKREEIVNALLAGGIRLDVMGARWKMYKTKYQKNIRIYPEALYRQMLGEMADSSAVLNIQPFFADAPHDRIANAVLNGCVCVSDGCGWLHKNFENGKDYINYEVATLDEDVCKLRGYLSDLEALEELAASSWEKGSNILNWENYCRKLFDNKNMNRYDY